jgi:endogenous inhibitor of DNA gyrase (YacG/DUF329 family)
MNNMGIIKICETTVIDVGSWADEDSVIAGHFIYSSDHEMRYLNWK